MCLSWGLLSEKLTHIRMFGKIVMSREFPTTVVYIYMLQCTSFFEATEYTLSKHVDITMIWKTEQVKICNENVDAY